jgi:hypothetical protein
MPSLLSCGWIAALVVIAIYVISWILAVIRYTQISRFEHHFSLIFDLYMLLFFPSDWILSSGHEFHRFRKLKMPRTPNRFQALTTTGGHNAISR